MFNILSLFSDANGLPSQPLNSSTLNVVSSTHTEETSCGQVTNVIVQGGGAGPQGEGGEAGPPGKTDSFNYVHGNTQALQEAHCFHPFSLPS